VTQVILPAVDVVRPIAECDSMIRRNNGYAPCTGRCQCLLIKLTLESVGQAQACRLAWSRLSNGCPMDAATVPLHLLLQAPPMWDRNLKVCVATSDFSGFEADRTSQCITVVERSHRVPIHRITPSSP